MVGFLNTRSKDVLEKSKFRTDILTNSEERVELS